MCVVAKWKIFRVTYRTLLSNAKTFQNDFDNKLKRSVWMKHFPSQENMKVI